MKLVARLALIFLLIISLSSSTNVKAHGTDLKPFSAAKKNNGFIENKGQIIDQNSNPNLNVKYLLNSPGFNVQLRTCGFSYDLYWVVHSDSIPLRLDPTKMMSLEDETSNCSLQFCRIDFDLVNADPNSEILVGDPSKDYFNYYTTGTPGEGVRQVQSYKTVLYKNIYPGIDIKFLLDKEGKFKYNFIIKSGGNLESIKIRISGIEEPKLSDGKIILQYAMGEISEEIPESYYYSDAKTYAVSAEFNQIDKNIFEIGLKNSIPINDSMLIDPIPNRIWATYFGGSDYDMTEDCKVDLNGFIYAAGSTKSVNNIATAGSFQSSITGGFDVFLVKFDEFGQRLWATYYGGFLDDLGLSICLDHSGMVYVSGTTRSTTNISTPGAFKEVLGVGAGGRDCFLSKFTPGGIRIWGTYYGGAMDEDLAFATLDHLGNIYLSGLTPSVENIATSGTFQPIYGGGAWDGFLAKFDTNGQTRLWATYYGGTDADAINSCTADSMGHIIVVGSTWSTNGIASTGAYQPSYAGEGDGLIAMFDSVGQRKWGTYYGGTGQDLFYYVSLINCNYFYSAGVTQSLNNIASIGSYQVTYAGGGDAFLCKFDTTGQRIWGTYFGSTGYECGLSSVIGDSNNVYLFGGTTSPNNIASPGSFQPVFGGNNDAFLSKIDENGNFKWSTYYGGTDFDWARKCDVDTSGHIYLAGGAKSTTNIASPGAFQQNFGGGSGDGFIVKMGDCTLPDSAQQLSGPSQACVPSQGNMYSIQPIPHSNGYTWHVPPGAVIVSGFGTNSITVDFSGGASSGIISVYGKNFCGNGDSTFMPIAVHGRPVPSVSGPADTCTNTNCFYSTESGKSNYQWNVSGGGTIISGGTSNDPNATVIWNSPGMQWVSVSYTDANNCTPLIPTTKNVSVSQLDSIKVSITSSSISVCLGTQVTYTATPVNPGSSPGYQWKMNGLNAGTNSTVFTYAPVNGDIVTCVLTSSLTTCVTGNPATSNPVTMTVDPPLTAGISIAAGATSVCAGDLVTFTATPTNPGSTPVYQWKVNGVNSGTNSTGFTYTPVNGDVVTCILTSSLTTCVTGNPATSNPVTMTVDPPLTVGISIAASTSSVCAGDLVTFTATPVNPGSTPVYQWKVNGVNAGTNSSVFSYAPVNADVVVCTLTSSLTTCVTNNPASSIPYPVSVNPLQPVSVSIAASANPVCAGTSVTFTASPVNPGSSPVYQWKVNGVSAGTNSTVFTYVPVNGDVVVCTLTSSLTTCVTNNPASCIPYPVSVNAQLPVSVTVSASSNPVCSGTAVTFTANPTNPGSAPVYQWKVNGVNSGTNSNLFTYIPSNNDQVWCVLTSSEPCAINNPSPSTHYPVTVNPLPPVSFTSCFDTITTLMAQAFKLKGGVPIGGTYSGPGVNSSTGYFTPSIAGAGVKTITYSYQNTYSCIDVRNRSIIVQAAPAFSCGQLLTDIRDGKTYPTVLLGTQCWMQKNLDHGIMTSAVNHQKDNCTAEKYCYNDDAANCSLFGGLYQWDELMQYQGTAGAQGACPPGWHVPKQGEWMTLFNFYQNQALAGKPLQDSIISGFRALESGVSYSNAAWKFKGFASIFWSSTPSGAFKAMSHGMNLMNFSVSDYYSNRSNAFGVRCVRD